MLDYIIVSDFLHSEVHGGCELNNKEIQYLLTREGFSVREIRSQEVSIGFLKENSNSKFIITNFVRLPEPSKKYLENNLQYIIYEHDHKYLINRDPSSFKNYTATSSNIINYNFYRAAMSIFGQTKIHADVIKRNLKLDHIINIGGNLWSEEHLDFLEKLAEETKEKENKHSVFSSPNLIKGSGEAINFCETNKKEYEFLTPQPFESLMQALSKNEYFVFLPLTLETCSRIVLEARMLGCKVVTTEKVGALSEEWFKLKGKDLIDFMRVKREEIKNLIVGAFEGKFKKDKGKYEDITVILNLYRRPQNLKMQLEAIRSQTIKPKQIWLWVNAHEDNKDFDFSSVNIDRVFKNDYNWKFYGRFAGALLADTEYVALFDDDTIPGSRWFENCLSCMKKEEGIMGSAGIKLNGKQYVEHERIGWPSQNEKIAEVDLVGHAWFLKRNWLKYLWQETPPTWENGEDIQLSYSAQKYGNIKTFCPPHPKRNKSYHGSILGNELGIDSKATSADPRIHQQFFDERDFCVQSALKNGWQTVNGVKL